METWQKIFFAIKNYLNELSQSVFNVTGKVEITNNPDIQKVEVINHQEPSETVEISNLIDYRDLLKSLLTELKVNKNKTDINKIISSLDNIITLLSNEKVEDYSMIVNAINESSTILNSIKDKKIDLSLVLSKLDEIKSLPQFNITPYVEYDRIKVSLSEKELENFGKEIAKNIIIPTNGGNSGIIRGNNGEPFSITNLLPVSLFDQNGNGLDIQQDISSTKNRLLTYSKIQGADVSEDNTLVIATEDGAMLSARGAVLLAGVDNLTTNIRQRLLQTEVYNSKNHLLVKDVYSDDINSSLNRIVAQVGQPNNGFVVSMGGINGGLNGLSAGDYSALNLTKDGGLRVHPSTGSTDVVIGKEASVTISGADILGVAAFQNNSGRAVCPALDINNRIPVYLSNLERAEDSAHSSGHNGIPVWARRIDTVAASSGSSGDYSTFNQDANGQGYVTVGASTGVIGLDTLFDADADNTAQSLKASAGKLYSIHAMNINNADAFIQFFDLATGSVTVGTTTPKFVLHIPKGDATDYGKLDKEFVIPVHFGTAITYAVTTTPTGSGDPSVGIILNGFYK